MYTVLGVGHLRRAAQPCLVVQVGRDRHLFRVAAGRVHGQPDLDGMQLAEASVADQLAGDAELGSGALLAANLEGALLRADDVAYRAAFGEGHGEGFLDVDVFAGQRGGDNWFAMPMVRSADSDGIHVAVLEQFAVVAEGLDRDGLGAASFLRIGALDKLLRVLNALGVQIADGDDPGDVVPENPLHVHVVGNAAAADLANLDLVAGRIGAENG